MNILTNWIFWIVISAIVFVLAIIGYLSESKKKNKKVVNEINNDVISSDTTQNVETNSVPANDNVAQSTVSSSISDSDFNIMPEVNSVSVTQPSNVISNSSLDSNVFSVPSTLEAPTSVQPTVVETPAPAPVQPTVVEATAPAPVQSTVVETPAMAPVQPTVVEAPVQPTTIEPASVFTSNIDQTVPSTPTPIPAESIPSVTPTPIPAVDTEVKAENLSDSSNGDIDVL